LNVHARFELYFSYGQFMVYDQSVRLPGCVWTDRHSAQGFARRECTANFSTPLEFGHAHVSVSCGNYRPTKSYDRAIAVPFLVTSGSVVIAGPEETTSERNIALPRGNYRLVAAQRVMGDEEEMIDLFFEPLATPLDVSAVLIADQSLNPPPALLETAEIAGEA
jgi:hypothetical protein